MHISLAAQTLFYLGSFPVTNAILTSWIVTLLLIIVGVFVGLRFQRLPGGVQQFLEMAYEMVEDLAVSMSGEKGKKFVPLAVTFFLYIIISNWLGLLPGVGSLGLKMMEHGEIVFVPLVRSGTADLNTTAALAVTSVVAAQYFGIRNSGILGHLKHFINPLEIVAEFSKLLSFSFRLFGNVFAGEVLLAAAASIIVIITGVERVWFGALGGIIQLPFILLELLVGFIQAFVFASLTLAFIGVFTQHGRHEAAHA